MPMAQTQNGAGKADPVSLAKLPTRERRDRARQPKQLVAYLAAGARLDTSFSLMRADLPERLRR